MPDEKPDRIPAIAAAMTPFPWVIDIGASLVQAREMMIEHQFRHLPVVENATLIGVVSDRDIHLVEGSVADAADRAALTVRDALLAEAYVVSIHEPLDDVLLAMSRRHLGYALVVKDGRLAGIFTATDACLHFATFLRRMFPRDDGDNAA